MPYRSQAQSAYIHAKAAEGEGWAKRFVAHSHGTHVPKRKRVKRKRRRVRRRA